MILAYYEILHTDAGTEFAEQLRKQLDSDPLLQQGTKPWSSSDLPPSTELYSLIVVVTEDLADASKLRQRVTKLEARGFPVIPVVPSVATYDFKRAPLPAIVRRNAVGLDDPEFFVSTLLHHSGLRHHASGGKLMISYARIDGEDLAKGLCEGLEAAGFEVFVDTEKIEGGSRVQDRIKRAIEDAELVLLVDSQGSDASRWVAEELEMARAAHTPALAVTRGRDGYHSFRAPHIPWPANGSVADVAETAVTAARRLLARTATFRARVARAIEQLAKLQGWLLDEVPPEWLVRPNDASIRVACMDDYPTMEDIGQFRKRLGSGNSTGLLVAGTRPFKPLKAEGLRKLGGDHVRVTTLGQVASALAGGATAGCLRGCRIFLSAAMPDQAESEVAAHSLAPFVITLIQTAFSLGATVVFGGHPSITPMIHKALVDIAAEDSGTVELHQARLWVHSLPEEARDRRVFEVHWHGNGTNVADDLTELRNGMIGPNLDAAVFVGGKVLESKSNPPGIIAEYQQFRDCPERPARPAFLLGLGEGAAKKMIDSGEPKGVVDPLIASELATTRDPDLATAMIVAELFRRRAIRFS